MPRRLAKAKLDKYRKLIEKKREDLLKELGYLEDTTMRSTTTELTGDISAYSFHMADQGTDAMEREKAFLWASREGRFLYHLNEAMARIQDGTYGYCEECRETISDDRLEAVPHCRLCIACKTNDETRKDSQD
jgi:DnaK suppressor protein